MKYRLLDLLACPICKSFPLKLYVFNLKKLTKNTKVSSKPLCELYCGYRKKYTEELNEFPCDECINIEIESGLLYCSKCNRWYPIEEDIPRMLPDNLRNRDEEISFLIKYREKIPINILNNGKPFNIKEEYSRNT